MARVWFRNLGRLYAGGKKYLGLRFGPQLYSYPAWRRCTRLVAVEASKMADREIYMEPL